MCLEVCRSFFYVMSTSLGDIWRTHYLYILMFMVVRPPPHGLDVGTQGCFWYDTGHVHDGTYLHFYKRLFLFWECICEYLFFANVSCEFNILSVFVYLYQKFFQWKKEIDIHKYSLWDCTIIELNYRKYCNESQYYS